MGTKARDCRDYFTLAMLAYAVLPLKRVQIGQTYNVYNFVKKRDFFVLRSRKVKRMIPKHAMDLFIEMSQGEICVVLLKIKVHGSMQSLVYRPTVYHVPSVTLFTIYSL